MEAISAVIKLIPASLLDGFGGQEHLIENNFQPGINTMFVNLGEGTPIVTVCVGH
jgi:hypothetical protein